MKILIATLICCFFALATFAQNTEIVIEPTTPAQKEQVENKALRIELEFAWANSFDAPNRVGLIEHSNFSNKTTFAKENNNNKMFLTGEIVTGIKGDPDEVLGIIGFGVKKDFRRTSITAENSFYFMHQRRFGIVSAEIAKRSKEHVGKINITPFSRISGYYALENTNNHVSNGVTWTNGLRVEAKIKKDVLELSEQLIVDSGSIEPGKRVANFIELKYLFSINDNLLFGPKIDSTYFLRLPHHSEIKKNAVGFGFVIVYKPRK